MTRSSLDTLTRQVTAYFRKHAARYQLDSSTLEARYILNWGGFVNASFQVTDGQRAYHLKLADDEYALDCLERWHALHEVLSAAYHAPRLLDWLKIPRSPFEGALFEYIPGQPFDPAAQPEVQRALLDLLARLHADRDLAAALAVLDGEPSSCADYFIGVYIDRFDEDLRGVAADLPPFVSLGLLDWMMGETRELEGLARDLPAFQHPADAPTHGDLSANNVLVTPGGSWTIIDWDDLALGDPALEYGIVLGPQWYAGQLSLDEAYRLLPAGADLRARFAVCLRALVLDKIIDSLADWVESDFAPQHQAEVRAEKERVHRQALEVYRRLWPESV